MTKNVKKIIIKWGIRVVALAVIVGIIAFALSNCSKESLSKQYKLDIVQAVESGTVAQNEKFTLNFDKATQAVSFKENATGKVWSTTPLDYEGDDSEVLSAIHIDVSENTSKVVDFERSYDSCAVTGQYSSQKGENSITITYFFEKFQISVPVKYSITDEYFNISIDTNEICEGSTYKLLNISVAPFICSTANDTKDSYIFVPAANGGIMNVDSRVEGVRTFTGEVYGVDATRVLNESVIDNDTVKMPIFAIKSGNNSLFAVIDSGAESTVIEANAGAENGFSNVFPCVYVRGYDIFADEIDANSKIVTRVADDLNQNTVSVNYYTLSGEDADYNGMAKCYKAYLEEKSVVSSAQSSPYALTFLGAVKTKNLAFGVPYVSAKPLTEFSQVKSIITELSQSTDILPSAQLTGFTKSGIDVGQIGGGFDFASVCGDESQLSELNKLYNNKNGLLSVDFEMLAFNEGGSGLNTLQHPAKTASLSKGILYYNRVALRDFDDSAPKYYLVCRDKIGELFDKLNETVTDKGINTVSLSSFGRYAYSDYSSIDYYGENNMAQQVTKEISELKKDGISVVTDDSNIYAAINSDAVFNITTEHQQLNAIDCYIPFYQMVLSGSRPLYSEALNLTSNFQKNLLCALESGTALGFTVVKNYDTSFAATVHTNLYNSLYSSNKQLIENTVNEYKEYYLAIEGAYIQSYDISENGVAVTVFSNGVKAYTNHSTTEQTTEIGTLSALSFKFEKGA